MTQSVQSAQEAANKVSLAADQIQKVGDNLKSFANAAVSALAGYGLATSLGSAFEKFSDLERNQIRLKAGIEASGQSVNTVLPHYKALADEITNGSLATKGQVFNLIQQAQNMGKSGAELDRLVKNSVAFGAITGQSAESMFRLAIAFERGDERMVKFALGLRHASPGMDVMKIAQERLAAGYKVMQAEQATVSGQLEKLQRAFGGITMEVGKMVADAIAPFVQIMTQASDQFKALSPETKQYIAIVAALTLAFLGLPPAISTALFLFNALGGSFVFNTAMQVINLVGWLAWTAIIGLAQLAIGTFTFLYGVFGSVLSLGTLTTVASFIWTVISTAAMWLWNAAVTVATTLWAAYSAGGLAAVASTTLYSGAALAAKVAVWLLNAALTVKNVLLAGIPLIIGLVVLALVSMTGGLLAAAAAVLALVGTIALFTGGIFVLGTVGLIVWAVGAALWDVVKGLSASGEASQALSRATAVFQDWFGILKDIVKALQTDMPLAWELTKAAARVALSQLKDIWPPLWQFIKDGFFILWDLLTETVAENFKPAMAKVSQVIVEAFFAAIEKAKWGFGQLWDYIKSFGKTPINLNVDADAVQRAEEAAATVRVSAIEKAQKKLQDAAARAMAGGGESDETRAARAELQRLQDQLHGKAIKEAGKVGAAVGDNFNNSVAKELHKLDGVLSGSAEALHRINDYRDKLLASTAKPSTAAGVPANGGVPPIVVNPAAGARLENNANDPAAKRQDAANVLLQQIRDALQNNQNAGPVMFPLGVA